MPSPLASPTSTANIRGRMARIRNNTALVPGTSTPP
jgi:hypothetical protein